MKHAKLHDAKNVLELRKALKRSWNTSHRTKDNAEFYTAYRQKKFIKHKEKRIIVCSVNRKLSSQSKRISKKLKTT